MENDCTYFEQAVATSDSHVMAYSKKTYFEWEDYSNESDWFLVMVDEKYWCRVRKETPIDAILAKITDENKKKQKAKELAYGLYYILYFLQSILYIFLSSHFSFFYYFYWYFFKFFK